MEEEEGERQSLRRNSNGKTSTGGSFRSSHRFESHSELGSHSGHA